MKIYVKKLGGTTLPFQAAKKDDQGNPIKTNAAAYDVICIGDPKIVGNKYVPVPFEEKEVGNQWLRVDYIQYETGLFVQPGTLTHHLLIHPRSSNSDQNLLLCNGIGLIDNDYRGQILVRYKYVWQPEDFKIVDGRVVGELNYSKIYKKSDRVCQILVENTTYIEWEFVDELNQTIRGEGGFNSTVGIVNTPILGYNPNSVPTVVERMKKLPGIVDKYNESGGVTVKTRYTEEVKKQLEQ